MVHGLEPLNPDPGEGALAVFDDRGFYLCHTKTGCQGEVAARSGGQVLMLAHLQPKQGHSSPLPENFTNPQYKTQ